MVLLLFDNMIFNMSVGRLLAALDVEVQPLSGEVLSVSYYADRRSYSHTWYSFPPPHPHPIEKNDDIYYISCGFSIRMGQYVPSSKVFADFCMIHHCSCP